jgi:hypothetical protein
MGLNDIHTIFFNAHILFSIILGVWALRMGAVNEPLSGNFWGAVATITILAALILGVGFLMTLTGLRPQRLTIYFLYVSWLVVIVPGLFSLLKGREDRNAALAFGILCFFNAATSISMIQREVVGPWAFPA